MLLAVCAIRISVLLWVENMTPFAMVQDLSNRAAQRNDRVTSFFVNPKDQEITKCVTVIETLFANVVAEHNLFLIFIQCMTYARECLLMTTLDYKDGDYRISDK